MKTLDILLLIPLLFGAYQGYKKGLLLEVISIAAFILGILGAFKLLDWGINILSPYLKEAGYLLPIVAFLVLFIGIIILVNMLGKIIKKILDLTLLGALDNFAGAIIGLLKWALGVSIILWLAASADINISKDMKEGTQIYPVVASIAPYLFEKLSAWMPYVYEVFNQVKSLVQPGS